MKRGPIDRLLGIGERFARAKEIEARAYERFARAKEIEARAYAKKVEAPEPPKVDQIGFTMSQEATEIA